MKTHKVKSIEASPTATYEHHYGIQNWTVLGTANLTAIILYTDFTELSSNFTSTFRKQNAFETLSQIKERNRRYWWWSKTLRETVELFGAHAWDMNGPYYCGMSYVMTLPALAIRLCSPTSTSVHLEVALKFAGEEGIIIQFNTSKTTGFEYLRGFDCSFISKYKEEDERNINLCSNSSKMNFCYLHQSTGSFLVDSFS